MAEALHDIQGESDVIQFVDYFYGLVLEDDLLKPIFVDLAGVDWDEHLPKMYSFWSSILLGTASYHGAPFPAHAALMPNITVQHFDRWLELFEQTISTLFEGPTADTARQRARNIAYIFQAKLGLLEPGTTRIV